MTFHILVGQRKCNYPGEYAPEALAVMDENGVDENPDWLMKEQMKHEKCDEFGALTVMRVFVPDDFVEEALFPHEDQVIDGMVLKP